MIIALALSMTLSANPVLVADAKTKKKAKVTKKADPPRPVAEPAAAAPAAPTPAPKVDLKGSAKIIGFGPARQITVKNESDEDWTGCEFRLPTNKRFMVPKLEANDTESVVLPKFNQDGVELDKPLDQISVKCEQGSAVFSM